MLKTGLLAFVLACGGGRSPTTQSSTTTSPAAGVFELGEMQLLEKGEPWFKIHADGSTEIGYRSSTGPTTIKPGEAWSSDSLPIKFKPGPRLAVDGTIGDEKGTWRLTENGTFVASKNGTSAPVPDIVVTQDSIVFSKTPRGDIKFLASSDGTLTVSTGLDDRFGVLTFEGADTPSKRRALLALAALVLAPPRTTP
jgi:hypothetical protein